MKKPLQHKGEYDMIKAVLFDLDGTVADTNHLIFQSFRYTLDQHGIQGITDEEIYSHYGEPLLRTMLRYAPEEADELVKTYHAYNLKTHDELIRPFPGVAAMLRELTEMGLKLGIVTSKRHKVASRSLQVLGISHWFQAVVTPEDTVKHKPEPEPVLKGAELLGVAPQEAMMVGDSPYDLLSGRSAGTLTCGVEYTKLPLDVLLGTRPDFMIREAGELVAILEGLNGNGPSAP